MFLGEARKLCPNLKVLSYDFPLYEQLSEKVLELLFLIYFISLHLFSFHFFSFPAVLIYFLSHCL